MTYDLRSRWRGSEGAATIPRMRAVLAELDANDEEHPAVSLTHESEWCLAAYQDGLLVWGHLETGEPRHMTDVPREKILALWIALSRGEFHVIEAEDWLPDSL